MEIAIEVTNVPSISAQTIKSIGCTCAALEFYELECPENDHGRCVYLIPMQAISSCKKNACRFFLVSNQGKPRRSFTRGVETCFLRAPRYANVSLTQSGVDTVRN